MSEPGILFCVCVCAVHSVPPFIHKREVFFIEVVLRTAPPSSEHAVTEMWDCPTAVKEFAGACC